MRYPHRVRIYRHIGSENEEPDAPVQDDDTGVPGVVVPSDPDEDDVLNLYEGPADVQDKGTVIERDTAGTPTRMADALVFLPEKRADRVIPLVKVGDIVEVSWQDQYDSTSDGAVEKVVRLDGTLAVRYL